MLSNSSVYVEGPGGHVSRYSIKWLTENTYQEVKRKTVQPRILWNTDIYKNANIASAKWDTFMKCDAELKAFLQIYLLYGIAFVDGVPATVEATEALSERVSLIRYVYASCYTFIVRSHFHKVPYRFFSTPSLHVLLYNLFYRETTYGKMWCFTSDLSRGDTAYTTMALDRHTDTSYFHEPCG